MKKKNEINEKQKTFGKEGPETSAILKQVN
jgi:hypothetical protein